MMSKMSAAMMRFLGPNFLESMPTGKARTIPVNVKMDMVHAAVFASIANCSMMGTMIVGILYCMMVTAVATKNSTIATTKTF